MFYDYHYWEANRISEGSQNWYNLKKQTVFNASQRLNQVTIWNQHSKSFNGHIISYNIIAKEYKTWLSVSCFSRSKTQGAKMLTEPNPTQTAKY